MKILKNLKYIPIAVMAAGLVAAITAPLPYSLNNSTNNNPLQNYSNANQQTTNVQTVSSVSEIKIELSRFSLSSFAIVKDAINGDLLYAWGQNSFGELGIGNTTSPVTTPQLCKSIPSKSVITSVHAGYSYSVVVINDEEIYIAGADNYGQQGNGDTDSTNCVEFVSRMSGEVTHISAGEHHILAVVDGKLYAWGWNQYGQLGDGNTTNVTTPKWIYIPSGNINSIIATSVNSYLWLDNRIYAWGRTDQGATGIAGAAGNTTEPALVQLSSVNNGTITAFSAGYASTWNSFGFAHVIIDNQLYAWGSNGNYALGTGKEELTPAEVTNLPAGELKAVFSGNNFSAVQIDNDLYMSGQNDYGQLCNGTTENARKFVKMENYLPNNSTKYSLFKIGGMAITDGITSFWGDNSSGTFGTRTNTEINTSPVLFDSIGMPSEIASSINEGDLTASEIIKLINPSDNLIDKTELAKYAKGVNSFPSDAIFTLVSKTVDDLKGTIGLTISANAYYAADALKVNDSSKDFTFEMTGFTPMDPPIEISEPFQWWWILVGIGGAAVIGVLTWLVIKRQKERQTAVKRIQQQKETSKTK